MGAILAISVVGHPRNISVILFKIEKLAYEMSFEGFSFFFLALTAILFSGAERFYQLW